MKFSALEKCLGLILFAVFASWLGWLTMVSLKNQDKHAWMVKMQTAIDKNTAARLIEHGDTRGGP